MQGGSLWNKVKEFNGNFSEKDIMSIMVQICSAVEVLHSKGIAHRDIKLDNILCTSETSNFTVKLADFGFAKREYLGLESSKFTAPYVAPEVLTNSIYNISCDIWSLGVVMFVLCCGHLPFTSSNDGKLTNGMRERIISRKLDLNFEKWSDLTEDAKNLILAMLEIDPAKRINITQVLSHKWFRNKVSERPLNSIKCLKNVSLSHFKKELEEKFVIMRNIHSESFHQLNLNENDLYRKRMLRLSSIKEICEDDSCIYDNLIQN